jgi:hypothetical protein
LDTIKSRHEICGDLCHFFFGHGLREILFIALENVFQRAAVLGRASIPEQLD